MTIERNSASFVCRRGDAYHILRHISRYVQYRYWFSAAAASGLASINYDNETEWVKTTALRLWVGEQRVSRGATFNWSRRFYLSAPLWSHYGDLHSRRCADNCRPTHARQTVIKYVPIFYYIYITYAYSRLNTKSAQ